MMLRHDLINHPTGHISKANLTKIKADFSSFDSLTEIEMLQVCIFLVDPVKNTT